MKMMTMSTETRTDTDSHSTSDSWEAAYYWALGYRPERVERGQRSSFVFRAIPPETVEAYKFDRAAVIPRALGFAYRALLRLLH